MKVTHQKANDAKIPILKEYISKIASSKPDVDIETLQTQDLLFLLQEIYELNQISHREIALKLTLSDTQITCNVQKISKFDFQIKNNGTCLKSISLQREQIYSEIDRKEQELQVTEKQILSKRVHNPITQQLDELIEGISMCKEKCDLLEEENQEFSKHCTYQRNRNTKLKDRYYLVREKYDSNVLALQQMETHGQLLNQKMIKQLKIVNDLRYFIKSQKHDAFQIATPMKKPKIDNFISGQYSLEDTSSLSISTQLVATENELSDCISQVIQLKNELAQINSKEQFECEQSFGIKSKNQICAEEQTLVSSTFRYKTHQNLGESYARQRQLSIVQQENTKAFSELDEVEEDQDSERKPIMITDGMYIEDQLTPREPWYYKSALQNGHKKSCDQRLDFGSEKKRYKSKPSLASFTSNSSCNKRCTMTLKDDFFNQNLQQSQEVEENDEFKEKDTEVNNSYEFPGLVQQEQIISDSTILINRKPKQVKFECQKIENVSASTNIILIGIAAISIGLVGMGLKKLYKKYF